MPLTNPRLPRAVHKFPYCPLSGLMLHDIPRHLTFELDHKRKCTCKMIFFIILFIFCVHVHVWASLAVTCNKCVINCGFGQYHTQYTPAWLRRSGVYRTVLPSPQSITHKYWTGLGCRGLASCMTTGHVPCNTRYHRRCQPRGIRCNARPNCWLWSPRCVLRQQDT